MMTTSGYTDSDTDTNDRFVKSSRCVKNFATIMWGIHSVIVPF